MRKSNTNWRVAAAVISTGCLIAMQDAFATAQRTFVASTGLDTNACTLAAPCRSFAVAIAQTNAGGEVIVLDSAGYGAFTISKSVTIAAAPGVHAGISVFPGQNGVTVSAGPSDTVVLRGLSISDQGGDEGITIASAGNVQIENCTIGGMSMGIHFRPDDGLYAQGEGSIFSIVNVSRSVLTANEGSPARAGQGGYIRLSGNHITGNATGTQATGGTIATMGDNLCVGNGPVCAAGTTITPF